jgi:hypothetical protein
MAMIITMAVLFQFPRKPSLDQPLNNWSGPAAMVTAITRPDNAVALVRHALLSILRPEMLQGPVRPSSLEFILSRLTREPLTPHARIVRPHVMFPAAARDYPKSHSATRSVTAGRTCRQDASFGPWQSRSFWLFGQWA